MRQLPQVHKRFFRLKFGEKFEINGMTFQKENWSSAVRSQGSRTFCWGTHVPLYLRLWPWTKVRTLELVRDARPGGKSSRDLTDATKLAYCAAFPEKFDETKHIRFSDDERTGPSC